VVVIAVVQSTQASPAVEAGPAVDCSIHALGVVEVLPPVEHILDLVGAM